MDGSWRAKQSVCASIVLSYLFFLTKNRHRLFRLFYCNNLLLLLLLLYYFYCNYYIPSIATPSLFGINSLHCEHLLSSIAPLLRASCVDISIDRSINQSMLLHLPQQMNPTLILHQLSPINQGSFLQTHPYSSKQDSVLIGIFLAFNSILNKSTPDKYDHRPTD